MVAKRLSFIAVLGALSVVAGACSSNGSPSGPSSQANTATIKGRVTGMSASSQHDVAHNSSVGATGTFAVTQDATTTLTVSINGTNITSSVDGNGQFELTGVPPGDVTLTFSGAGVNASITLTGVPASSQINITVSLNGNSARLESESREDGDDADEDENENEHDGDAEGTVSNRSGQCPSLTFVVNGLTINTNAGTQFEHGQCSQVVNGTKVEIEGTRQGNTILAKEVDIKK